MVILKTVLIWLGCLLLLGVYVLIAGLRRYRVEGRSMLPAYAPGDRVLALPLRNGRIRPKRNDVVVVEQPGAHGRFDIKRIVAVPNESVILPDGRTRRLASDEWFLMGDNAPESTDSRTLGPAKTGALLARVLRKY
jgi:signal peptidase I